MIDPKDDALIDELARILPPFFPRTKVEELTAGAISKGYMAYLDCVEKGPEFFKIGRKVMYRRDEFIDWLKIRRNTHEQFEPYGYGERARRPQGAHFGFERRLEGPEG